MKSLLAVFLLISFVSLNSVYSQIDDIYEKIKKETKKEEKKEEKKLTTAPDTDYVSAYHRTHKGEIAFCTVKDPDLTSEIAFGNSFGEKDIVTACVYLEKHINHYKTSNESGTLNNYYVKASVDDEDFGIVFNDHFNKGDINAFAVRILGTGGIISNGNNWGNRVIKMSPGDHKIKIEVWGGGQGFSTSAPIAKGEFTFVKDEPEKEKSYGKFSDVQAGMHDSKLEADAVDVANRKAEQDGWKERYSKAVINSYDWETRRNDFGIITHRTIFMTLLGTWPDGTCRKVEMSFFQDYNGSGYSKVLQYYGIGAMWLIECE